MTDKDSLNVSGGATSGQPRLLSDQELRTLVTKSDSARLIAELMCAQSYFTEDEINAMDRGDLITHVCELRKLAKVHTALKSVVSGFKPRGAELRGEVETRGRQVEEVDPLKAMMAFMLQSAKNLQEEKTEKERCRTEENRLRERLELEKEKLRLQNLQEEKTEKERCRTEENRLRERLELEKEKLRLQDLKEERQSRQMELERQTELLKTLQCRANDNLQKNTDMFIQHSKQNMEVMERRERERLEEKDKLENRLKRASELVKNLLYNMPDISSEIPAYLNAVENIFVQNQIREDLRITLLTPYLSTRTRKALSNIPREEIDTYQKWKDALLKFHKLTPQMYKNNFDNAFRTSDETCVQFGNRLMCSLKYYLNSRNVTNFDDLLALLVSDRLKQSFTQGVKYYVSDRESGGKWLRPFDMGELVDQYEMERGRSNTFAYKQKLGAGYPNMQQQDDVKKPFLIANRSNKRCMACGMLGHISRFCKNNTKQFNRGNFGNVNNQVRMCRICKSPDHYKHEHDQAVGNGAYQVRQMSVVNWEEQEQAQADGNDVKTKPLSAFRVKCAASNEALVENVQLDVGNGLKTFDRNDNQVVTVPKNLKAVINFGAGDVEAIIDSGAMCTVIAKGMLPSSAWNNDSAKTQVTLQGAFGESVSADMMVVPCRIVREGMSLSIPIMITVAVTDCLINSQALLSLCDYSNLMDACNNVLPDIEVLTSTDILYTDPSIGGDQNARRLEILAIDGYDMEGDVADREDDERIVKEMLNDEESVEVFKEAQRTDASLSKCWDNVKEMDSIFFVHEKNNLLYRKTVILGLEIHQLLVPQEKRDKILNLAHDCLWAGHMGSQKTLQRIQAYFYWPGMAEHVKNFVKTCKKCQMCLRKTKADRIPIVAVERSNSPFEQVNIDLIGPIEPKSSRGYRYVICLVDSCTKWADAKPLKSLTAKETCEALLNMFSQIGLPNVAIFDHGTNFVSEVSTELHKNLGVKVRFSSVAHPEGNSAVERFNAILKGMLHHVIVSDKPREWDLKLPYLLWAYREVPCNTTGVSPYQLVYGKVSRGPLSVLKDNWSDYCKTDADLKKSTVEYLTSVKENLELVRNLARNNTVKAVEKYVDYYNLHANEKCFDVGDAVLVLFPSSTNKLLSVWQGPGIVTARVSKNTYRVGLENGAVKVLHANHLRRFNARVASVGVIFESDVDYGNVVACPNVKESGDTNIDSLDLSHLDEEKQVELRRLLNTYKAVFSDKPGSCKTACHEINLVEGFEPKRQPAYRIPDKLKGEVEKQIGELLEDGKIRPSNSPFSHPVVCVSKPDGSIRLCADLRYVNSGTRNLPYPMPQIDYILSKMASASWISCLDCTSGFWQIPMKKEDIYKTAMITHHGLWEWVVMPFGCRTASSSFQRVMDDLLRTHSNYAHAYIDDTGVFSKTWKSHLVHLERILKVFLEAGMTLKLSKCKFGMAKVKFVGHVVGSGTRSIVQSKVEAIKSLPEPTTKKMLRSFLGACNFFRMYISMFADIAAPLTDLTSCKGSKKILFQERERQAFSKLKNALCNAVTLYAPNSELPYIIRCDASDIGVGATLSQIGEDKNEHPIAFASAKLNETMKRYSVLEREAFAVLFALKKFDVLVYGCKIFLYTDHNPLQYIANNAPSSAKLTRWSLSLTRYDITVNYIPGPSNVWADYLSRCSVDEVPDVKKALKVYVRKLLPCNEVCCNHDNIVVEKCKDNDPEIDISLENFF